MEPEKLFRELFDMFHAGMDNAAIVGRLRRANPSDADVIENLVSTLRYISCDVLPGM